MHKLKDKERNQIINALRAGVVPPIGLRHIQVGRKDEINEMMMNLVNYILISDVTLKDGETIGFTEEQKLKIKVKNCHFI